ncbi:ATP-binding protein [uncultured Flavobacterium sp.]|uniref:sensor histidine kinase n=1 Tax=uncultured Flavobacterium sp. TaxID=165435 RepID=UPI0030C7C94E
MNSLLKRQIAKLIQPEQLKDLRQFLKAVNDSYDNYEDQLGMSQRAMKISSDELFEANQKLREEANSLKEINENLSAILTSMNLDATKLADEKNFNQSDYLKQQASEIVIINKQREELLKDLALQNEELSEYAHVVSHDLKAPLRNIDTLVNWVIEDNKDGMGEDCVNSLNLVLSNVEKMDLLIKGILDYSTIDKLEAEDRQVDFNFMIDEILRTIDIPKNIKIIIQPNMPSIYGNAWRFKQVFQNLIQNAIKYNDKEIGKIEVGFDEKAHEYEFFVKDNGIGINSSYFSRIFKVFTKLESNNSSSGIGLSIVKKIVQYYKGQVWLESQENIGTTFYFSIPK